MKSGNNVIATLKYEKKYDRILFAILVFIGLINNMGSVLVVTSAKKLAEELGKKSLLGFYTMAIKLLSSITRFLNSKFCIKISYMKRVIFLVIYFLFGYLSLFAILTVKSKYPEINSNLCFALSLIPAFIMGSGEALGEVNVLGYLRTFPGDFIAGWSTGTGLAGIVGSSITLAFGVAGFSSQYLFLYVSPAIIVYYILFLTSMKLRDIAEKKAREKLVNEGYEEGVLPRDTVDKEEALKVNNEQSNEEKDISNETNEKNEEIEEVAKATDVKDNKSLSIENFLEAFKMGKYFIINIALVYYLEYVAFSGFAAKIAEFDRINIPNFQEHANEILILCYQVGVFISRSSLFILKYNPYVIVYTLAQCVNYVFLFLEAYLGMISTWWLMFIIMVETGLMGGSSYVSCLYYMMNSPKIESKIRELCLNIGTIFNDIGIVLASITTIVTHNTILETKQH